MEEVPRPSRDEICRAVTSLAWVEPSGVVHWMGKTEHSKWAMMYLNPENDPYSFRASESNEELLKRGWLRVTSIADLQMTHPDKLSQQAWDAWAEMSSPCLGSIRYNVFDGKKKFEPESKIVIDTGTRQVERIPAADLIERYCSKRAQDSFWRTAMSESTVRRLVREMLLEDLKGFIGRTSDIDYFTPVEIVGLLGLDTTYHDNPWMRSNARAVKVAWSAEADHNFMKSVTKIHWMQKNIPDTIRNLVASNGRDEISTMGYIDTNKFKSGWGFIGLRLDGRVTLAAKDMGKVLSGRRLGLNPDVMKRYQKTSGVPRRASVFEPSTRDAFILDADSFGAEGRGNEFIIDNWKVTGVAFSVKGAGTARDLLDPRFINNSWHKETFPVWIAVLKVIEELKIPYVNKKHADLAKKVLALESSIK